MKEKSVDIIFIVFKTLTIIFFVLAFIAIPIWGWDLGFGLAIVFAFLFAVFLFISSGGDW